MRAAWRDRLAGGLVVLLLLAGAAVTAGWLHLRSSVPVRQGELTVPGLATPATVRSDSFAIPHVSAESERDLFFVQGWLHAGDRLWQMELFRRTAAGRLAELFGPPALEADRLLRTLDLWGSAVRGVEALAPGQRGALEAYAAGVNAWLEHHDGSLPPEFVLLGVEPEPWTPAASAAVGKVMALDLSAWHRELSRHWAATHLTPTELELLRPAYPPWGPTVLEAEAVADLPYLAAGNARTGGTTVASLPGARSTVARDGTALGLPWRWLGGLGFSASNNWAVAGSRTSDGFPLVANDMHLGLRAPAIWYVMGLHAGGGLEVAGLSLPGAPGIVVGFNRGIAWSFTNGMVDDMDFAVETVNLDGSQYRTADGWRDFAVRQETIDVRGEEPELLRVRETVRGPVITDVLPELGATMSALWLAARPTGEVEGVLAMNRATSPGDFRAAIGRFDSPQQNVVWASTGGTLGYGLSGRVPLRPGWDGGGPVAARRIGDGWPGTWSPDSMPAMTWPPGDTAADGFVASANNLQARPLFGPLGVDYPTPFRARRIVDRLRNAAGWTADSAHALQQDVHSLLADRLLERAVAAARRVGDDAAVDALGAWDRSVSRDALGASLFYAWVYRLRSLIAADEFRHTGEWGYFPISALLRLLEAPADDATREAWVDDDRTEAVESLAALEERAMRDASAAVDDRPWGEIHRETNSHPLARVGWLDRIFGFEVGPYPSPGAPRTVRPDDYRRWNAVDTAAWRPPWRNDYGPSERLVVDLGPGVPSGAVLLPTGQSGVPLDPHYRDMNARWRADGPLVPLPLDSAAVDERTVRRLRLLPAGSESPETPAR